MKPTEKKPPVGNVGYYHSHKYHSIEPLHHHSSESCVFKAGGKMTGIRRVVLFCVLVVFLPAVLLIIPLYIKNSVYASVAYDLIESDVLEISQGISNVFCSEHNLHMNGSVFNAFQVHERPETTSYRKHIRLKKSMILPDDTLEYWGFYLWKGATVALSLCSRFEGASILVVKGEKELRTCGMLDHNKNKALRTGIFLPEANQVEILFESDAQEINSKEHAVKKEVSPVDERNFTSEMDPAAKVQNSSRNLRNSEKSHLQLDKNETKVQVVTTESSQILKKKLKLKELEEELKMAKEDLAKEEVEDEESPAVRKRRNNQAQGPAVMSGQGIRHGGNNVKNLTTGDESSVSSFELGLLTCYEGQVLVSQEFNPSEKCLDVNYLMTGKPMQTIHNVMEDGYYYYIFYSDNDIVSNDIHAVFDIYKPTLQYENVTQACMNQTECRFELNLFSKDRVIVEVPTRDGIEHETDDIFRLVSECEPRMEIYAIFPIAILVFVLGCAFI